MSDTKSQSVPDPASQSFPAGQTLRVPCVLMRGGTSRGLIFRAADLPADQAMRDLIFLAALGSPDIRQLDGVGAGDSHTSKICVVEPGDGRDVDMIFQFGEVSIREARVDYAGNSGNIISALGLYAVEEGWVPARAPETLVRIHNTNTNKRIEVAIPVADGAAALEGEFSIDGVPGTAPRVEMRFPNPGGTLTGRLLPTGNPLHSLPAGGGLDVTLLDAANPVVLADGAALGVSPRTPVGELNQNGPLLERLESLRAQAAAAMGLVPRPEDAWAFSNMIPFPVLLFPPQAAPRFDDPSVETPAEAVDLLARVISLGMVHKSINVTVSVALTAAALVPGTLAHTLSGGVAATSGRLRIGHPSGIMQTSGALVAGSPQPEVAWVGLGRTARRIMEGHILVQPHKIRRLQALLAGR